MKSMDAADGNTRALVLIVADDTGQDLEAVLSRMVEKRANNPRWHFLCVDGGSANESARAAARWLQANRVDNADVLRSPLKQGPGGCQKLGFRYAIEAGFDFVIKPGADGRDTPELLPRCLEALEQEHASVIVGSATGHRTQSRHIDEASSPEARRFRMPAGRRMLNRLQGLIAGHRLSDYQCDFRAYTSAFLRSIPFEINTNDLHFDTEILLQALNVGAGIEELDLPLRRRGETDRGRGYKYAIDVIRATVVYRMHHFGMFCSLKHRHLGSERYRDKTWIPYSSHARALEVVRRVAPRSLVDIGCGPGHVARLIEEMGVRVTGIDRELPLPHSLTGFHQWDLEKTPLPVDALAFEMVLMLDIIEHLANPEDFLVALRNVSERAASEEPARVVITTPNIAFASIRLNLLLGRFNYAERGILDITHKRLFTRRSLITALEDCGYQVEQLAGIGAPFDAVMGGRLGRFLGIVSGALADLWPSLFAFQFLVVCRPLPGVRQLLSESRRLSTLPPFRASRSSNRASGASQDV